MGLKCSDSPDSCFREHGENKFNQNIYISWKKQKTLHSIQEPVGRNNTHIMVNLQTPWNLIIVNLFIARHHSLKPIAVIQNINSSPNAVKWEVYEPTQCKESCADVLLQRKAEDCGGKKRSGLTAVQRGFLQSSSFCSQTSTPRPLPPYLTRLPKALLLWVPHIYSNLHLGIDMCLSPWADANSFSILLFT